MLARYYTCNEYQENGYANAKTRKREKKPTIEVKHAHFGIDDHHLEGTHHRPNHSQQKNRLHKKLISLLHKVLYIIILVT